MHTRPINTLRERLVAPKDKTAKLDQSGVIYKIQCDNCPASYIGETERKLGKRVVEHKKETSAVGSHMSENKHQFSEDSVSVLSRES